jgi:hypothetical protein
MLHKEKFCHCFSLAIQSPRLSGNHLPSTLNGSSYTDSTSRGGDHQRLFNSVEIMGQSRDSIFYFINLRFLLSIEPIRHPHFVNLLIARIKQHTPEKQDT